MNKCCKRACAMGIVLIVCNFSMCERDRSLMVVFEKKILNFVCDCENIGNARYLYQKESFGDRSVHWLDLLYWR